MLGGSWTNSGWALGVIMLMIIILSTCSIVIIVKTKRMQMMRIQSSESDESMKVSVEEGSVNKSSEENVSAGTELYPKILID